MRETLIGPLPDGWDTATLGDLCARGGGDIQTGPFGTQLHARDYVADGVPSVMPRNIGDNVIREDGIARVGPADAERLGEHRLRTGDIVYSRRGDVERRALVRAEQNGWLCGTGCLRIRPGRSVSPAYLAHYLGHPAVRRWVVRHAVGVTMLNLNTAILSAVPVVIPPRPVQDAIAEFLDTLESKIRVNERAVATAVDLGTALFTHATSSSSSTAAGSVTASGNTAATATTAATVAAAGVISTTAIVDDGGGDGDWAVLGDIVDLVYGKALKETDRQSGSVPVYGSQGRIGHHDTALTPGPAVIVGRKGHAGAVSWAPVPCWPIDTAFAVQPRLHWVTPSSEVTSSQEISSHAASSQEASSHATSSRETRPREMPSQETPSGETRARGRRSQNPSSQVTLSQNPSSQVTLSQNPSSQVTLSQEFLFFLLRSLGLPRLSADSAVPGLGRSAALSLPIRLPSAPTIATLTAAATSLLRLVDQMERENHTLTELRDTLLPKLISGQLHIPDADDVDP